MTWYVAFVAILNLCLGYALGTYLGAGRGQKQLPHPPTSLTAEVAQEFDDGDEYYSDDQYDAGMEDAEYESAVTS